VALAARQGLTIRSAMAGGVLVAGVLVALMAELPKTLDMPLEHMTLRRHMAAAVDQEEIIVFVNSMAKVAETAQSVSSGRAQLVPSHQQTLAIFNQEIT